MPEHDANPELSLPEGYLLEEPDWTPFDIPKLTPVNEKYPGMLLTATTVAALLILAIVSTLMLFNGADIVLLLGVNVAAIIICLALLWHTHRWANSLGYGISELEVITQDGVWWQSRTALPYSRIQHVTLSQGPLERRYGLAKLKCYSAGSGSAEIEISGLTMDSAERLRGHILAKAGVRDE